MTLLFVIYFSILFLITELILLIVKKSIGKKTEKSKDKKSLLFFWVVIPLSITAGFMKANYGVWQRTNEQIAFIGLTIFIVGFIIRWLAIYQLKKEFTVDVTIIDTHHLKTDGLYRILRHPSYFGLLLMLFGLSVGMNSLASVALITIPIILALLYRIKVEERALLKAFGTSYAKYLAKTKSLIPWVY